MSLAILPFLLFPAVLVLAAVTGGRMRGGRKTLARAAWALTACAGLCIGFEAAQMAARNAIRIDLFVTLPGIALGALALGIASLGEARTSGAALVVVGVGSLGWFGWSMSLSGREAARLTVIFRDANLLYWQETSRCEGNLTLRFGPSGRRDHPCHGHFRVTARRAGAYPFTRVVVNDRNQAFFLFSPDPNVEVNYALDDGPLAEVAAGAGDTLMGRCKDPTRCSDVMLRALAGAGCEAKVAGMGGRDSILTLAETTLPACDSAPGMVQPLGVYSRIFSTTMTPPLRQLVQVWLWEVGERVRAILLVAEGYPGNPTQFNFVKPLEGVRTAPGQWMLDAIDLQGSRTSTRLAVTVGTDVISISGDAIRFRTNEGNVLPRGQVVSPPKIALIPLRDEASFTRYFDNVLHNLSVPWTPP